MLEKILLDLTLFGDGASGGGDGSSASIGESGQSENSGDSNVPAFIPEKAKKYYKKAMEKTSDKTNADNSEPAQTAQTANAPGTTEKLSYAELIKSDEYKEEHKAYMDKTIGDRLKKYKGIEESLQKHKELLDTVAYKYGVSPEDEKFLDTLKEKIDADDSYYENYAMEHDISTEEARRIVTMERKAAQYDAERESREKQEQMRQQIMVLRQNAEKTKSQFPHFDLDTEMQSERFRRLCAANNGDTTAAYMACHWNEILPATVQMASKQIQAQTAQAIASNKQRPIENGISSVAPSVVQQDFRNMNLRQIRQYAEEQRRQGAKK